MGFKNGNDQRAWVALTQAGTYYLPAGQQDLGLDFDLSTFDASTKDSGGFEVNGTGLTKVSLTLGMQPSLPDANGYGLLEGVAKAYPRVPVFIKVRKGGDTATDADTMFAAAFWVTKLSWTAPKNNAFVTPFSFTLAAAPFVLPTLA